MTRLDVAANASSGMIPVITPNDSGAVSETNKKSFDGIVNYICTDFLCQVYSPEKVNFNNCRFKQPLMYSSDKHAVYLKGLNMAMFNYSVFSAPKTATPKFLYPREISLPQGNLATPGKSRYPR